ncbi:general odorant-binding protein 19d isoform X2 [Myzus persicae]|uniref:general odorant-binding protein 19d isoform X2 n=1 Tax=Myzus persicae TaxID=13164 RepID=UPI000B9342EB|nr:general odorant-binding protein 19d isoform X2 [Myzus persicae]
MKICYLLVLIVFTSLICNLKGQQIKRKSQPKFNRFFGNISRECLKEHRVTPERVLGVYTLNINDREAKCYVACMLLRFNVTTRNGGYNEKELEQLMAKPNSNNGISISMKTAIAICEKQVDRDHCEKAVKFTKCIYSHRDEFVVKKKENISMSANRRPPFPTQEKRPVRDLNHTIMSR